MISRSRLPIALAISAGVLGAVAACLSERVAGIDSSTDSECFVALTSDIIGSTQALVAINDFSFQPAEVRIKQGSTVTWVNCEQADIDPHTSSSDAGTWDSPFLPPGATFSHTFDQVGRFPYHCEPHLFMVATIVVE